MMMTRDNLPYCDCDWLERAAHDSHCPVEFDPKLNEYMIKTSNGGSLAIYHCPFCAGRAPKSLRDRMFASVTHEEAARLHQLTKDLKTEQEVLVHLGKPTHVFDPGATITAPEIGRNPGETRMCRSLHYDSHSSTANINVNVDRHGKASISFSGKYIGKPAGA